MRIVSALLAFTCIILAGCETSSITLNCYDSETGKREPKVYSNYYFGAAELAPQLLKADLIIQQERSHVPVWDDTLTYLREGYSQATGYWSPGSGVNTFRLCLKNIGEEPIGFELVSADKEIRIFKEKHKFEIGIKDNVEVVSW